MSGSPLKQVMFPFLEEVLPENVVRLGQYPDQGNTDDWLMGLPVGTEFLSRPSFTTYELEEYEILEKSKFCVKLLLGNHVDNQRWVISQLFSRENLLVEVLRYGGTASEDLPSDSD